MCANDSQNRYDKSFYHSSQWLFVRIILIELPFCYRVVATSTLSTMIFLLLVALSILLLLLLLLRTQTHTLQCPDEGTITAAAASTRRQVNPVWLK
jgi:hypothetical protein